MKNWLRKLLGVDDLERRMDERIKDLERHFVTKRDPETGIPTQTLADVPVADRKHIKPQRGMSIEQRRRYMEATDGGRNLA